MSGCLNREATAATFHKMEADKHKMAVSDFTLVTVNVNAPAGILTSQI